MLPEAGDRAIGVDTSNLMNFGGYLLNGSIGNGLNSLANVRVNSMYGKYFVDANKAFRGMV